MVAPGDDPRPEGDEEAGQCNPGQHQHHGRDDLDGIVSVGGQIAIPGRRHRGDDKVDSVEPCALEDTMEVQERLVLGWSKPVLRAARCFAAARRPRGSLRQRRSFRRFSL